MLRPNQNRVIVLAIIESGLTPTEAAERFGISRQWVHSPLARHHAEGDAGVQPRSRRPWQSPTTTPQPTRELILSLRDELTAAGLTSAPTTTIELRNDKSPSRQRGPSSMSRHMAWRDR